MILPALKEAAFDRGLPGHALRVLVYLHGTLELGEYRPLKQAGVADDLAISRPAVQMAVQALVDRGYLRRGQVEEGNITNYMLLGTRGTPMRPRISA